MFVIARAACAHVASRPQAQSSLLPARLASRPQAQSSLSPARVASRPQAQVLLAQAGSSFNFANLFDDWCACAPIFFLFGALARLSQVFRMVRLRAGLLKILCGGSPAVCCD